MEKELPDYSLKDTTYLGQSVSITCKTNVSNVRKIIISDYRYTIVILLNLLA